MSEETDYAQLLRTLEEERADIDRLIAWVNKRIGQEPGSAQPPNSSLAKSSPTVSSLHLTRLASDEFFRMSVPQAIKAFLNLSKRPKSAKEITAGLQNGGLAHKARNLYATVYPTLLRMEKAAEVVRVRKGEWGLTEWYPGGRKVPIEKQADSNNDKE